MERSIMLLINSLVEILSFFMLVMGLMLSLTRTVHQMIPYYQWQCGGLALVTFLTAIEPGEQGVRIGNVWIFVIIPILLGLYIESLLAQATVAEDIPVGQRLLRALSRSARPRALQQAMPAWLHSRRSRRGTMSLLAFDLCLVALAFITAFTLAGNSNISQDFRADPTQVDTMALAVSFSLLLLGITTMINTEDIISQVIGLLVMEQGMFLVAVRFIPNTMRVYFILGLFLYITITLTILVFLLPELHQKSGSLDIDKHTHLKG